MANFDSQDLQRNQTLGGVGYLGILFLVPLIACPNSRFGRYCANQGLLLTLASIAGWLVFGILGWLPLIGGLFGAIRWLYNLALALVAIYYAYLAITKGDARELPILGKITLLR